VANVRATQTINNQTATLKVITYEELVSEERTRQVFAALGVGLAAAGNSISASQAGRYNSSSTVYTPRGAYQVDTTGYSPTAAAIAQSNANAENAAMIGATIERGQQNMAALERGVSGCVFGDMPARLFNASHMRLLMEIKERQDMSGAANNRRKYLSVMFAWALAQTPPLVSRNPARDVKSVGDETDGFYTWTDEDIVTFEARHAIGTKARLALALLMFTGMRRQDAIRLGPPSIRNGLIEMTPKKTKGTNPELTYKPLLAELKEIIEATPVVGSKTFLVTAHGKPFSEKGFGNWFKARCMEAKLPQCTAHGLRKAAACRCADAGVSEYDMMQLFDWSSSRMAAYYTKKANKKRAAARTIQHLSRRQPASTTGEQTGAESVPPKVSHLKFID
jgi:integrase